MQRTWFCAYQQPAIRDCVIPSPTHTLPFPNAPSSFWCFLLISKHCTASCNTAPAPSLHPLQQAMLRASLGWKPVTNKHSLSAYGRCSSSSAAVTNFQWLPTAWITSKNVNLLGPYPLFPDTSHEHSKHHSQWTAGPQKHLPHLCSHKPLCLTCPLLQNMFQSYSSFKAFWNRILCTNPQVIPTPKLRSSSPA